MSSMRTMAVTGAVCGLLATLAVGAQRARRRASTTSRRRASCCRPWSAAKTRVHAAALDANLAGNAAVDVTVDADGRVRDVLLAKSLDAVHGLDDAALATAGRWVFKPGTLNGQPVPVRREAGDVVQDQRQLQPGRAAGRRSRPVHAKLRGSGVRAPEHPT